VKARLVLGVGIRPFIRARVQKSLFPQVHADRKLLTTLCPRCSSAAVECRFLK